MRRMMLAAGVVTSAHTPTTTTPRTFTLPTVADPHVMAMRPTWAGQVLMAPDGDNTAAGGYASTVAAVERAKTIQRVQMAIRGIDAPNDTTRICIGVLPGTYTVPLDYDGATPGRIAPIDGYPFIDFVELSGQRGAATIAWGFGPSGGSHYWEGINIAVPETNYYEPKYPVHLSNQGVNVWTRMDMSTANTSAGGGNSLIGTDGDNGGVCVLHDVHMLGGGGTNQHGWATNTVPATYIYSKVTTEAGGGLGYGSMQDNIDDSVWVVDCATDRIYVVGNRTALHISRTTKSDGSPLTSADVVHVANDGTTPSAAGTDNSDAIPWPTGATTVA